MSRDRYSKQKPIRQQRETKLGFTRRPFDEPLTPGLRKRDVANAIGFLSKIVDDDEDHR